MVWLHSEDLDGTNSKVPHRPYSHNMNLSVQDIRKQNLPFEHSFQEIESKASPEQRKYIFENLHRRPKNPFLLLQFGVHTIPDHFRTF
jgi:hypothetical protein